MARSLSAEKASIIPVDSAPAAEMQLRSSRALRLAEKTIATPPTPVTAKLVALVASVRVNEVNRGERFLFTDGAGAFLMKQAEWQEISPAKVEIRPQIIESEPYVRLNEIPAALVKFDDATLTLSITLRATDLPTHVINAAAQTKIGDIPAHASSAILNYQLGVNEPGGGASTSLDLATDLNVRYGDWLFRTQAVRTQSKLDSHTSRINTQLIMDDRQGARQLIIGDFYGPQVPLASAVQLGGLAWVKNYQMTPYFIRYPTLTLGGAAMLPSTVDVYLGDALVLRERVAPGPFELRDFNYYAGQRNVRLVVRDMAGREQTIAYPFFFTPQGLAAGLHDFAYQIGAQRRGAGSADDRYQKLMFTGFHQYGLTDAVTIGLRAEGEKGQGNIGPSAILRTDRWGLLSLSAAASRNTAGAPGTAVSADYSYQSDNFNANLRHESHSSNYVGLSAELPTRRAKRDLAASVGLSTGRTGAVSASYLQSDFDTGPSDKSWTLSYSVPLWKNMSLSTLVRHRNDSSARLEWFLGFQYTPNPHSSLSASTSQRPEGGKSSTISYGRTLSEGEGLAYGVSIQSEEANGLHNEVLSARGQYNARAATLTADVRSLTGNGSSTAVTVSAAGAIAIAPGFFGFGRPMADSFAVVQLSPPIAGVRVYENSQMVGRSNAQGQLVLPNIQSYTNNAISLDDKDIPIEFAVERLQRSLSPAARSGTVLMFPVVRVQSIIGTVMMRQGGIVRPLEYRSFTLSATTTGDKILTGKGGEFYVENLAVGTYRARMLVEGRECIFDLTVPKSDASLIDLEKVLACDFDR